MTYRFPITDISATVARVKAAGGPTLDPTQTSGHFEEHGVPGNWVFADGILTLTIPSKPWYLEWGQIQHALEGFFGRQA